MRSPSKLLSAACPRARHSALSGQVAVLFVCLLFALVVFAGLAVDFAGANRAKTAQEQRIEVVKDAVFSEGERIKFADRPDQVVFDSVEKALTANGYDGQVECLFYEVEKGYRTADGDELVDGRRVFGISLTLSGSYTPLFLSMVSISSIPIAGNLAWTTDLYSSSDRVWRPSDVAIGKKAVWTYDRGVAAGAGVTNVSLSDSGFPQGLKNAIDDVVKDA